MRRVALAGIDVYLVVGVFTVTVDGVFTVECLVFFEQFIRTKGISIDVQRLLLADRQQEPNRRFIGGFR